MVPLCSQDKVHTSLHGLQDSQGVSSSLTEVEHTRYFKIFKNFLQIFSRSQLRPQGPPGHSQAGNWGSLVSHRPKAIGQVAGDGTTVPQPLRPCAKCARELKTNPNRLGGGARFPQSLWDPKGEGARSEMLSEDTAGQELLGGRDI